MDPKMSFFFDKGERLWCKDKFPIQIYVPMLDDTMTQLSEQGQETVNLVLTFQYLLRESKDRHTKPQIESWIDLKNCIMRMVKHSTLGMGLTLQKNQDIIEIYGDIEPWFNYMKQYVVQCNFPQQYTIIKRVGKGNFADVFKVQSKATGILFAVKCFDKQKLDSKIDRPAIVKEINIQRKIQHEGIIRLYEVYESDQFIYLVMELLNGGELYKYLKKSPPLTEEKASKLIYKLLKAVEYIHDKGILHRDIKPENIILRDNDIENFCIADFGLADYYNENGTYQFTRCGTPGYVAPELLQDKIYDYKIDVYSVGVLMFILIAGRQPFDGKDYDQVVMLNYVGKVSFENISISPLGLEFLKALLSNDTQLRPTASEALQHPWFIQEKQAKHQNFKIRKSNFLSKQLPLRASGSQTLRSTNSEASTPQRLNYSPKTSASNLSDEASPKQSPKLSTLHAQTPRKSVFRGMKLNIAN